MPCGDDKTGRTQKDAVPFVICTSAKMNASIVDQDFSKFAGIGRILVIVSHHKARARIVERADIGVCPAAASPPSYDLLRIARRLVRPVVDQRRFADLSALMRPRLSPASAVAFIVGPAGWE